MWDDGCTEDCQVCIDGSCVVPADPGCTSPQEAEKDGECFTGECVCPSETPTECGANCCTEEQSCSDKNVCCDAVEADADNCETTEVDEETGCEEIVSKCEEGEICNGKGKCCPELEEPEFPACYELKDEDGDGCSTYVNKCGELGCAADGSGCCEFEEPSCDDCKKPEIVNGCYTGECIDCPECTYTFGADNDSLQCGEDYCYCTEIQLYWCANGQEAFTICCNPKDGGCSGLGCQPIDFWKNKDLSGECVAVSSDIEIDAETGLPVPVETSQYFI